MVIVAVIDIPRFKGTRQSVVSWTFQYLQFWQWRVAAPQLLRQFWLHPAFVAVTVSFFIVVISGLWSEDMVYWLSRVRLKIPLLVLPIAFYVLPPLSKKQFYTIWYVFFIVFTIFSAWHCLYYFTHFQTSNQGLSQGIPIKSFKSHIVFTALTALAVMVGIELRLKRFHLRYPQERHFISGSVIFLILALHIFSVRTGLLTLYICLFIKILSLIFNKKRILNGIIALILMAAIPILAYRYAPSFQERVNYALWDIRQYQSGNAGEKSDADRIISLKVGLEIVKQYPAIGVGFGDIMRTVERTYQQHYPTMRPREPHSYWIFAAVGTGLIGAALWFLAVITPLLYHKNYKNAVFFYFNLVFFIGNTVDYIFEGAIVAAFYAFGVSLFLKVFCPPTYCIGTDSVKNDKKEVL